MRIRTAVGSLGRALIISGVLILLFVGYQLWGTGLAENRSQDRLTKQFKSVAVPTPGAPAPPPAPEGEAVALISIPKIGLEKAIVQGVGLPELKKGPGHYPTTPMPGQPGNAAIAGHRTTYGAPFFRLDEMQGGDPILVTTRQGAFRYEVMDRKVVKPNETYVLDATDDNRLTLTTCEPRFSATRRLVVVAALKGSAAAGSDQPAAAVPATDPAGLSGDDAGRGPTVAWGAAAAAVGMLTWLLGRLWRRLPVYVLGVPAFLIVLFFFFENFSRLLPANY